MKVALAVLGVSIVMAGCAMGPGKGELADHHPTAASESAYAAPTTGQLDSMMRSMQEMHDKVMAARTPEERARLMQEHMKVMQDGMAMMARMRVGKGGMGMGMGGAMSMGPEMMGKRMDMMEMMMQMMMDREAMRSPAAR